jgi:hypothetical protein
MTKMSPILLTYKPFASWEKATHLMLIISPDDKDSFSLSLLAFIPQKHAKKDGPPSNSNVTWGCNGNAQDKLKKMDITNS